MLKAVTLALAGVASAAHGQTTPAATAPDPGAKRLCRTEVATGSIMPRHVCHTRDEWAVIDRARQRAIEDRTNNNTIDRPQGSAGGGKNTFGQ